MMTMMALQAQGAALAAREEAVLAEATRVRAAEAKQADAERGARLAELAEAQAREAELVRAVQAEQLLVVERKLRAEQTAADFCAFLMKRVRAKPAAGQPFAAIAAAARRHTKKKKRRESQPRWQRLYDDAQKRKQKACGSLQQVCGHHSVRASACRRAEEGCAAPLCFPPLSSLAAGADIYAYILSIPGSPTAIAARRVLQREVVMLQEEPSVRGGGDAARGALSEGRR